jgi:hypothetical protein
MEVSEIRNTSDRKFIVPAGFSFFEPYFQYQIKEILEIGGEVWLTRNPVGEVTGLFIYDSYEKNGTIYTRSREVFDHFYELEPFNFILSFSPFKVYYFVFYQ